jgi:Cu(I)/Ag(I) efflux system membrane protein CusA/SilA
MLATIIDWSGRNRFLVLLATLFVTIAGIYAVLRTPIDALPDLSDVQVIVYTEYPGQAPQVVEDQVTYPLTTAMLSVPRSRVVRGFSFFGASFVYIIFEDGTDIYWARSRVLEYLNFASSRMPRGVTPSLGPDATGVGWVYQYALLAKDKTLAELRTIQDWYVRYQLSKAHGVAEVASIGGFVQTYQVTVDPVKLRAYGIPLMKVAQVIRDSNRDVGGRVVEMAETEYMVRGKGYLRGKSDLEMLVVKSEKGTPVLIRDIARVELVPDERRGLTELNGEGEVVSGIAMARYGQNALEVIHNLKARIAEIGPGLPAGVTVETVYDRSELIHRAIETLKRTLLEESIIVAVVCIVFLLHVRSALVAILMLPVGILIAFIAMRLLGMNSNLMSLGGIAIAIGAMIDAAIVMIENAHKHLERLPAEHSSSDRAEAMLVACKEVGPALFFSLLIITVSFLPVFSLEGQEGRLFSPLAYTKTFAMAGAALLSITLVPVLMLLFIRGRILPEAKNPVNRFLIRVYRPIIASVMRWKKLTLVLAVLALAISIYPASRLGSEFMPTLNEGTLLYMPTSLPGMSITKAAELMQTQNRIIKSFPEVASVYGKAGRANTATDPAPTEMFETVINLKPESEWRAGMTTDKLIAELDQALQFPGVANAWTMPIKARIDMLSTGIRTPIGIKVFGKDLDEMEKLAKEIEAVVKAVPGTTSAFAERITGGFYLNIEPDREQLARYGLAVGELLDVIGTALGGEMVTTTVEGRERFGVSVRYPRELRSDPQQIAREVLIPTMDGAMIPLGQLARVVVAKGAPSIRTENALLSAYIYVDIRDRDIGGYVADAKKAVAEQVKFPPGYYVTWSGQFEYMERATEKMKIVIPVTLLSIFLLLYLNFKRLTETLIVMLSVPFALVGGIWLLWLLDYNLSVAVVIGFIALAGVAAETGVIMLIYLDHAWEAVQAKCLAAGARAKRRRPLRGSHGRRRRARTTEDDDRGGDHGRSAADHVGYRHRFGSDEPHRRTDGWRDDFVNGAYAGGDSGDLRAGQAMVPEAGKRTIGCFRLGSMEKLVKEIDVAAISIHARSPLDAHPTRSLCCGHPHATSAARPAPAGR